MQAANLPPPPDQAANHSTMERVAARIPGTTEYENFDLPTRFGLTNSIYSRHAERHHPALGRQGRANLNTAQANAALPPNVNPNIQTSGAAGTLPATHHQQQFAAPASTAVQPQPGYTGLPPTTGQKIIVSDFGFFPLPKKVHQCL